MVLVLAPLVLVIHSLESLQALNKVLQSWLGFHSTQGSELDRQEKENCRIGTVPHLGLRNRTDCPHRTTSQYFGNTANNYLQLIIFTLWWRTVYAIDELGINGSNQFFCQWYFYHNWELFDLKNCASKLTFIRVISDKSRSNVPIPASPSVIVSLFRPFTTIWYINSITGFTRKQLEFLISTIGAYLWFPNFLWSSLSSTTVQINPQAEKQVYRSSGIIKYFQQE